MSGTPGGIRAWDEGGSFQALFLSVFKKDISGTLRYMDEKL